MGKYGAFCPKGTKLWSNVLYIFLQLPATMSAGEKKAPKDKNKSKKVSSRVFKNGKWHTTGSKDLEAARVYTP